MGDASINVEKYLLEKYTFNNIDFLKVGHHGSNTSTSSDFINTIKPKYSIISVGKNNRYGHPKEEVLDILKRTNIYRTDLNGTIEVKINKSSYKIKTYN
jgi:competence protein ComEC